MKLVYGFIMLCMLGLPTLSDAQTVESVLQNYYKAIGGKERLDAIQSAKVVGSGVLNTREFGYTYWMARDYKVRNEIRTSVSVFTSCYNGTTPTKLRDGKKEEIKDMRSKRTEKLALLPTLYFFQPEQFAKSVRTEGNYVVLEAINPDIQGKYVYYFDKDTYLLRKEERSMIGDTDVAVVTFDDYREVSGSYFPFYSYTQSTYMEDERLIQSIEINPILPEGIFDCLPTH